MELNAIKQMELYARYHPEVVSLSQGIPFLPSDESIRSLVIESILKNKVDKYAESQGILPLREAISYALQQEGLLYNHEEIMITAGAMEGLAAALLTILKFERNEVLIPTPTYSAYFRTISVAKGRPIVIPLIEKNNWLLDLARLEKCITKRTAAILICNPNNPTGSVYPKEVLQSICMLAQKYNVVVILDEVYKNMIFDKVNFYTPAEDVGFKNNLVRIVSFSKDFSLTGWRVGFLHSRKDIVQKIIPVHDAIINCVPVVSQYAALAALQNKKRILANNQIIYKRQRDMMKNYLDSLSSYFSYSLPQGSYFFFPRFSTDTNSEKFCMDLLKKENVAVVPGSDFGLGGENHIRLCFGRSEEEIHEGMKRLTKYVSSMA